MDAPLWKVELHTHTIYSGDCLTQLSDLHEIVQKHGLDRLAITDHNTATAALEMARRYPLWVIPGEEIMTSKGELLAWYIQEEVPAGLSPMETIDILKEQNAVISVSHPFDRYRKGAWKLEDLLEIIDYVDAIEVFNSRCIHQEDNDKALAFAQERGLQGTCGSDAHTKMEYGRAIMRMQPFANNADGLRQSLESSSREETLSTPMIHFTSRWAKWRKKLQPSLRPQE